MGGRKVSTNRKLGRMPADRRDPQILVSCKASRLGLGASHIHGRPGVPRHVDPHRRLRQPVSGSEESCPVSSLLGCDGQLLAAGLLPQGRAAKMALMTSYI